MSSLPVTGGVTLLLRHWPVDDPVATVLLVHGVSEHSGRWVHVAEHFSSAGFEVWAYDHRGHGGSGGVRLDTQRFEDFVDDLDAVMHRVRGDRPLVVYGHSLGGLVTVLHAISERAQPDLLVLSAPALEAEIPAPLVALGRVLGKVAPRTRIPAPIDVEQLSRDPAVGARFRSDPMVHLVPTARFGLAYLDAAASAADLDRIGVPTLVVHGGDDTLVPTDSSRRLGEVEGVVRVVYPGARHELHNEPDAATALDEIIAWIDRRLER